LVGIRAYLDVLSGINSPIPAGIQTRDCLARSPLTVPSDIFFPVFLALVVGF
jgi:hypothetical protein